MDTYVESLRRAAINDPDAARKYENAINRLMSIGHLETLYRYHEQRTYPVAPTTGPTITENHLREMEDEWSWQHDELSYRVSESSLRLNEIGYHYNLCTWDYQTTCSERASPDLLGWCFDCLSHRKHRMSVVRLILIRQGSISPTFVSFDDTNEEHMAAKNRTHDKPREYGHLVQLWSEKFGKYVYRDTNVNDWNTDWTVEYHFDEWWYEMRCDVEEDKEYALRVDEGLEW